MARAIWKFEVQVEETFQVSLPEGATVLSVDVQYGVPQMWALVEPGKPLRLRTFHVYGTGHVHSVNAFSRFVGSFQLMNGSFVGHLFED